MTNPPALIPAKHGDWRDNYPEWFRAEIRGGLSKLLALKLPFSPRINPDGLTEETKQAFAVLGREWVMAVWGWQGDFKWTEYRDTLALRDAFSKLAGSTTEWPGPGHMKHEFDLRPRHQAPALPFEIVRTAAGHDVAIPAQGPGVPLAKPRERIPTTREEFQRRAAAFASLRDLVASIGEAPPSQERAK